jgi:hypothetical protein
MVGYRWMKYGRLEGRLEGLANGLAITLGAYMGELVQFSYIF